MKLFAPLRSWTQTVLRRSRMERDMDAEMRAHIEAYAEDLMRGGISSAEAMRRARMEFGAMERVKEECRESRGIAFIESLRQDLRFALRMLRKSPGFTAIAVLTLALGIGANTTIFSAIYGLLLQPLPYADSSRLVTVEATKYWSRSQVGSVIAFSGDGWRQILTRTPEFTQSALYSQGEFTLTGGLEPQRLSGAEVSGNFFSVLGARPLLGRPILDRDTDPVDAHVAVASYMLWKTTFGANPHAVGHRITVNGTPYKIVGVMPPEVDFAAGQKGLWLSGAGRTQSGLVLARLKPGFSIKKANAQLRVAAAWFAAKFPKLMGGYGGWELNAYRVERDTGKVADGLWILFGAVGFVLLIACVNVSGLLLAHGWSRRREVSIRAALGATRGRITRQFLSESLLLALTGGAVGLLFSVWGIRLLRAVAPPDTPHLELLRLNPFVLAFTAGISVLCGVLFGLAPALQASMRRTGMVLNEGPDAPFRISLQKFNHLGSLSIPIEIGFCVILVTGSALVARSLDNMMSLKLGFRTDHILTLSVDFSNAVCNPWDPKKITQCQLAVANVLHRIRNLPGVRQAAASSDAPLDGGFSSALSVQLEGQSGEFGIAHGSLILGRPISPGYFQTMGIPLLAGKSFDTGDAENAERVVIVNQSFAQQFFAGHALGHRMSIEQDKDGRPEWMEIVGEVGDTRDLDLTEKPAPQYYVPYTQATYFMTHTFLARTSLDPLGIAAAIKQEIWALDKDAPVTEMKTMDQVVAENTAEPRFRTFLFGSFSVLGLLLATVGVYGVTSYSVARRTHEIGVRMALGAQRFQIMRLIIGQGAWLGFVGAGIGVAGAFALTRVLTSMLFEVKPVDPALFAGVAVGLVAVVLAASYIPARRAMKVDPMVALRYE